MTDITRKDFLNATLLGAGAALLTSPAPAEAMRRLAEVDAAARRVHRPGRCRRLRASNGDTKAVIDAAHKIRDGAYKTRLNAIDTGEVYDLLIVGGGITGLTAAYFFAKTTGGSKRCLVLENHPIFGGEAKQNEFLVNGVRLMAPQGSNDFGVPRQGAGWQSEMWDDLAMPREFTWSEWDSTQPPLRMARDNYQPMEGVGEFGVDVGYFFDDRSSIARTSRPTWLKNIWQNDLAELPVTDEVRRELAAVPVRRTRHEGSPGRSLWAVPRHDVVSRLPRARARVQRRRDEDDRARDRVDQRCEPRRGQRARRAADRDARRESSARANRWTRSVVPRRQRDLRPPPREEADSRRDRR